MRKIFFILSVFLVSNVMATTFIVTVNCHVPNGFTYKHVTVEVDLNSEWLSDAKKWAEANGERLCKQYAPDGYWFDSVYNVKVK